MEIKINNPFSAKQGLKMALEIARYELSSEQIDRINVFINHLDNTHNKLNVITTKNILFDLEACVSIFKKSDSIQWIREDFVKEVLLFDNIIINNTMN